MLNTASLDTKSDDIDSHIAESAMQKLKGDNTPNNNPDAMKLDMEVENEIVRNFHKKHNVFPDPEPETDLDNQDYKDPVYEIDSNVEHESYVLNSIAPDDYYKGLYVRYDIGNKQFIFKDKNNTFVGSFTIYDLVRYIGSHYDIEKKFMRHLDDNKYNNAKQVIKKFVVIVEPNQTTKTINIMLLDYEKSPFMGDIEMLIKLNADISVFEKMELDNELKYVDIKYRDKIKASIKNFIYQLLNYTLKLISITSAQLADSKLKANLLEYSAAITYRITQYVQEQYVIVHNNNIDLRKTLNNTIKLRQAINSKIDNIGDHIAKQSMQLNIVEQSLAKQSADLSKVEQNKDDDIIDKLTSIEQKINQQVGGFDVNYKSSSDSSTSSDNPEGYVIEEYADAPVDASNYNITMSNYLTTSSC